MHALRLGLQGTEFLTTGRITLPVPEPHRTYLRPIRHRQVPLAEVLRAITGAEIGSSGSGIARLSPASQAMPGWMTGCTEAT
jgi:hypothetical protein